MVAAELAPNATKSLVVDSSDRSLRDSWGRQVILHGVNVVYKQEPYMPDLDTFSS